MLFASPAAKERTVPWEFTASPAWPAPTRRTRFTATRATPARSARQTAQQLYGVSARMASTRVRSAGVRALRARPGRFGLWASFVRPVRRGHVQRGRRRVDLHRLRARVDSVRVGSERMRTVCGGEICLECHRMQQLPAIRRGAHEPPGAAVCDICEADYYYDGQSCLDCPWSATCARNSTLGSQWIVDEGFYRFSMDTPEIYRCKRNDGCVGGAGSGDDLCANHHHGPLCHLCDRGYYMEPVLRTCQRCDRRPSTFLMVAFFFFVLLVLFVFAVLIWSCVWGSGDASRLLQALKSSRLRRWVQTHFGDFFRSDCARAIWYSWTVLVRFSSVEDVKYPGPFAWVMRIYGLVTLDLVAWLPTPCIRWSYYDTLLAATLLPVAYVVVAWLYNLGRRHLKEKSAEPMTPEQKAEQKDEKIEQLRHLIESNIGTAKHYSNEGWPPWLLEAENCIDLLLDELGADRKNTEISRARQIIADYAIKKKGKKSMEMPPGALRSFVEFADARSSRVIIISPTARSACTRGRARTRLERDSKPNAGSSRAASTRRLRRNSRTTRSA